MIVGAPSAGTTMAQAFDGTIEVTVVDTPAVTTGRVQKRGMPVFFDDDTGEPVLLDPWLLKKEGRIGAPAMIELAKRGHGKTSNNMHMVLTFSARKGYDGGVFRASGDDHRGDDGRPEYELLAHTLGVEEVPLATYQLNCLDMAMGMKYEQQLGMLKELLKHVFGNKMSSKHAEPLRYALLIVRRDFPKDAELGLLAMVLRTIGDDDARELLAKSRSNLDERHADNPKYQALKARTVHISKKFQESALELAAMIEELLDGEYGGILGGQSSLSEVLQRRFVIFDYSGLSDEAVMLVQAMMWYWRAAAIANRDFRFRFDMEFHDENYKMWAFPVYAKAMHRYLKQLRSYSTFVILSTHRFADYETVGSKNSKLYKLAMNSIREIDMFLIGQLDSVSAEEAGQILRLTSEEVSHIQRLKVGHWGLKIGSEPIVWVRTELTDDLKKTTFSDEANERMLV